MVSPTHCQRVHLAALAVLLSTPLWAQNAPELLFKVTFDDLTSNAQVAEGNPKSTLARDLGLTAKEGYNKKSALLLDDGEECAYEVKGNLDLSAGTISFWCRPHNWSDKELRYQKFFWVHGFENRVPFNLYVDSPNNAGSARVVMTYGRGRGKKLYQLNGKADWGSRKWHKVDVTWDRRHLAIYVNGRLGERKDIEGIAFPKFDERKFMLVPIYHHGEGQYHSGKDRSLIDDFEIWSNPLSGDRILQRYTAETGGEVEPPTLVVPRAEGAIKVDGRLDERAWTSASRVPIPINAATMYPHSEWAYASICYDDRNLYVGFHANKVKGLLAAKAKARDGAPWHDDAFELYLNPSPKTPKDYYQFVVNSAEALFDARFGSRKWNGAVTFRANVEDDHWTIEAAVPFRELGVTTPQPGDRWLGNFCRDYCRPKPAGPIYTTWAYLQSGFLATPERYGRLIFIEGTRGARLSLSPMLNAGALDVAAEGPAGKLAVSVASAGSVVLATSVDATRDGRIAERLEGIKEGILTVALRGAGGEPGFSHSMRFMVKEPIDVAYLPDPTDKRLSLIVDLANLDADWHGPVAAEKAELAVSFRGPKGDEGSESFQVAALQGIYHIPFAFETGDYEMTYRLSEPSHGRPMLMVSTLEIPELPWVGTQVGVTNEVLEPWTPMQYRGDTTIACWGRSYTFDGPFLTEAVNQGRDILAGPIRMELTTTLGTGTLTTTQTRTTRRDPERAEFSGEANFGEAGIAAEWATWMEYDGLTVATVTLIPGPDGSTLSALKLRIPLRSDVVRYLRGKTQMGGLKSGRIPWDGERYEDVFAPFLWVCNEREGFVWFSESEAGWVYPDKAKPIVVQGGKDAFVELQLISTEAKLTKPQSYTYGFQATPVKPMARDRRAWNFGMHRPTKHINARNWMTGYSEREGNWKIVDVDAVREFDAKQRAEGVKLLYYGTTSCTADHNPTFNLYEKLWTSPFPASFPCRYKAMAFRPARAPHRLASVCPGSPSFQEFMLYYADEFLRECGVPGIYTDTDGIWACDNAYHDHRFTDVFGRTGVTYTILSKRRYAKRKAAIMRSFKRERRYWMTHAHAKLVPPVHGWADFWLPGEENTHNLRGNKWWYMDTLDDLAWRVEYQGHSSGLVHHFLPEFKRGTKDPTDLDGPQPSESLLAMCAVADVNTTGGYLNMEAIGNFWGLRKRLNLIDADFTGYWQPACPVRAVTRKALASVYKTKGGVTVIAIANRLADDTTVEVDLKSLKPRAVKAVDERTGNAATLKGNLLAVPVKGRNYTFVSLR